jgi:hypothetical protein
LLTGTKQGKGFYALQGAGRRPIEKNFDNEDLDYYKITVDRYLRLSFQVNILLPKWDAPVISLR